MMRVLMRSIDDIEQMSCVVVCCEPHLAQEETAKRDAEGQSYKPLKH
jgi:hypothetical protein